MNTQDSASNNHHHQTVVEKTTNGTIELKESGGGEITNGAPQFQQQQPVLIQPMQQATIQIIPSMNGDNTLLKALLQAAPKNSVSLSTESIVQSIANSSNKEDGSIREIKSEMLAHHQQSAESLEASINNVATNTQLPDDEQTKSQQQQQQAPPAKKSRPSAPRSRVKAEKIISMTTASTSSTTTANITVPATAVAVSHNSSVTTMSDNDVSMKIYDYLKQTLNGVNNNIANVSHIRMSQPKQPMLNSLKNTLLPNYPGKVHQLQAAKLNNRLVDDKGFFQLDIEPAKQQCTNAPSNKMLLSDNKRFIEFILNDTQSSGDSHKQATHKIEQQQQQSNVVNNSQQSKTDNELLVKNYFRVLNSNQSDSSSHLKNKLALIDTSRERLNDLLDLDDECINQIERMIEQKQAASIDPPIAINDAKCGIQQQQQQQQQSSASSMSKSKKIINIINNLDKLKAANMQPALTPATTAISEEKPKQPTIKCKSETNHAESETTNGETTYCEYLKKKIKLKNLIESYSNSMETNEMGDKYEAAFSPIIDLCTYEIENKMETDSEEQKQQQISKCIRACLKLDKRSVVDLKSTLRQLTNILSVNQLGAYDLGQLAKLDEAKMELNGFKKFFEQNELIKKQNEAQLDPSLSSATLQSAKLDTKFLSPAAKLTFIDRLSRLHHLGLDKRADSVNLLLNLIGNQSDTSTATFQTYVNSTGSVCCKFCEAILVDSTNVDDFLKDSSNVPRDEALKFCCSKCTYSFKKLARLKSLVTLYQQQQQQKQEQQAQELNNRLSMSASNSKEDLNADEPLTTSSLINNCLDYVLNNQQSKKLTPNSSQLKRKNFDIKWFKWNQSLFNSVRAHAHTIQEQQTSLAAAPSAEKFETLKLREPGDKRSCCFCGLAGDQDANGPGRLLIMDMGTWCHLNCALWSDEVYETMNGSLINVDTAYRKSYANFCFVCKQRGASLKCFFQKCTQTYHLPCAIGDKCTFNQDKTFYCSTHSSKVLALNPSIEVLNDLSVDRNVWIERDEVAQLQAFVSRDVDEEFYAMRIGSLILHNIGQLLPHQLSSSNFHNRDFIYPIGYKATRFYWSFNNCYKRCKYICSIGENDNFPEFQVKIVENDQEVITFVDKTPSLIWNRIIDRLNEMRKQNNLIKIFPAYLTGEYQFGLAEPHIVRLIESLPGVETLTNYVFKYGRLQLLDMPLTINPTGCARSEPKLRTHFRKSHKINVSNSSAAATSASTSTSQTSNGQSSSSTIYYSDQMDEFDTDDNSNEMDDFYKMDDNITVSYNKQFVLSKSTQYKKLKSEWRANVYLAKSRIQGLGLYAARDLEKGSMIIEYIGDLIRNEVANTREKLYQSQNRGVYMFRLNDDSVVDATITGGLARYVNHCCDPNCVAETVSLNEREQKIIIIANKRILKGEELTYDYKFDFEDESNKISCLCGSANCKKWMN